MTLLGNLFLVPAVLVFIFFLYIVHQDTSGPADGGYGMGVLLFSLLFTGLLLVVTIAVNAKGGYNWAFPNPTLRNLLVFIGFFAAMTVMTMSALFKHESGPTPWAIKYLVGHAVVWIPMVLLFSSVILLNDGLKASVPRLVYAIPLGIVFGVSMLSGAGLLIGWGIDAQQRANQRVATILDDQDRYHAQHLADIAANDPTTNTLAILALTGKYHDADVREAAVAKIKTNPNWQQELIRLLDAYWAEQVFIFLEANEVDDKPIFAEPIRRGIGVVTERFRESMQNTHTLHADEFDGDTRRVLATVDKFQGLGVDYVPAIQTLRAALDEPRTQKIRLNSTAMLDDWLKAQQ